MEDEAMEVTVEFREREPLLKWLSSIAILKHVGEQDIGYMFEDGVLFFHLLRELFEEEIENPDELAEKILPCENFTERLYNWKTINDSVMQKLKIDRSNWYLEYLAKGNVEYLKDVLDSVRKIAPAQPQKKYKDLDIITETPEAPRSSLHQRQSESSWWPPLTYYCNENRNTPDYARKWQQRSRYYTRKPSPFPRMKLAREQVLWGRGAPNYNAYQTRPQHQRRLTPNRFQNRGPRNTDFRYFRDGRFGSAEYSREGSSYYDSYADGRGRKRFTRPPQVQTYCFLERQRKRRMVNRKRWPNKWEENRVTTREVPDVEQRFQELLEKYRAKPYGFYERRDRGGRGRIPSYNRYLYRYYQQFESDCNYCKDVEVEDDGSSKEEGEVD